MKVYSKVTSRSNTINILNNVDSKNLYNVMRNNRNLDQLGIQDFLMIHKRDCVAANVACEAAKNSDTAFLENLVTLGIDITIPNNEGFNAYYYAKENGNGKDVECMGENYG